MVVIGGPSSQLLAGRVAAILGEELAMADYKVFPDGEAYSQVATALGDEVTVIQSTPTDRDIICLMQLLDICQGKKNLIGNTLLRLRPAGQDLQARGTHDR